MARPRRAPSKRSRAGNHHKTPTTSSPGPLETGGPPAEPFDRVDIAAQAEAGAGAVPTMGFDPALVVEEPPHPEAEAQRLAERLEQWRPHYGPATPEEHWLFEMMVVESLRLERCQHDERLLRAELARRARLAWHDDRRLAAEELGRRLGADPSRTAWKLRTTAHGCEWLLDRWRALGKVAARADAWGEAQTRLAFDLLGVPVDLRFGTPWDPADPEAPDAAGLVAAQVARLERSKSTVYHELDDAERVMAELGVEDPSARALSALRRHEAACYRRMLWARTQLDALRRDGASRSSRPAAAPAPSTPAPVVAPPAPRPSPAVDPVATTNEPTPSPRAATPPPGLVEVLAKYGLPGESASDLAPPAIPCDACDAGLHTPFDWIDDDDDDLDDDDLAPAGSHRNGRVRGAMG